MSFRKIFVVGAAALLASTAVSAQDYKIGGLEIQHAWARATAPNQTMGAGYMIIKNTGTTPDKLVSVSTPQADKTEIHEVTMQDKMVRMSAIDGLALPPGTTIELAPNGYHVMFMHIAAPFKQGSSIPATLVFEKAGTVDIGFEVKSLTYKADHAGHDHGAMHKSAHEHR